MGRMPSSRAGSPLIELIMGVLLTAWMAMPKAAGLALSRQSGVSVTAWMFSISQILNKGDIALGDGLRHALARAVDLFSDDFHRDLPFVGQFFAGKEIVA